MNEEAKVDHLVRCNTTTVDYNFISTEASAKDIRI